MNDAKEPKKISLYSLRMQEDGSGKWIEDVGMGTIWKKL